MPIMRFAPTRPASSCGLTLPLPFNTCPRFRKNTHKKVGPQSAQECLLVAWAMNCVVTQKLDGTQLTNFKIP